MHACIHHSPPRRKLHPSHRHSSFSSLGLQPLHTLPAAKQLTRRIHFDDRNLAIKHSHDKSCRTTNNANPSLPHSCELTRYEVLNTRRRVWVVRLCVSHSRTYCSEVKCTHHNTRPQAARCTTDVSQRWLVTGGGGFNKRVDGGPRLPWLFTVVASASQINEELFMGR
jgi:hypothetical protein